MKENDLKPFAYDLDDKDIKRERNKAKELRASQWWKRCLLLRKANPAKRTYNGSYRADIARRQEHKRQRSYLLQGMQ